MNMAFDLVSRSLWSFPTISPFFDEEDDLALPTASTNGLSIAEDEKSIYVEASLPGINPDSVEITFDKGMLWVRGKATEEETAKKYHRHATQEFSYRVALPVGNLDHTVEPKATNKNGITTITFTKSGASQPKKITITTEK